MTVTKKRIIDAVFETVALSRKGAREAVESLLCIMKKTLADEKDILVNGFGKFQVRRKKLRLGRNPQTGEALELRPRRVVVFHTSGILRRKINGEKADAGGYDDLDIEDKKGKVISQTMIDI